MVAKLSAAAVLAAGSSAFINTVGAVASSTTRATRKQRDTQALLKSARRYNNNKESSSSPPPPRHLDGNNAFDGSYSIKFSQCIDIKLLDEDLFDEDVVEYTTEGQIISTASYALFHVCQTGQDCYYESQDDLYIVDLSTYVQNMALYHANAKTSYCDACDMYYGDYCVADAAKQGYDDAYAQYQNQVQNYGDDGVEEEEENMGDDWQSRYNQYVDDNNNNRRLLELEEDVPFFGAGGRGSRSRRATSYIDCDTCEAYGCGANDDDNNRRRLDEGDNDVSELISDIAGCLNTGLEWNGNAMYVGFMCSPYSGDGVELAIFLDNKCTVYTTMKAFSDIPSYYIYSGEDMFTQAEGYIKQAFNSDTSMSCLVEEYDDPANAPGDDDVAQAQANANVDYDEVNDYCANIFDMGPVALNSCASAANDDQANNNDDANNQVDDAGQQYDDIVQWYDHDMNYESYYNFDEVCSVIQEMEGEYYYQYDTDSSGTWNDHSGWGSGARNRNRQKWTSDKGQWGFLDGHGRAEFGTKGMLVAFFVILGIFMAVGVLFIIGVYERKKRQRLARGEDGHYSGGRLV